MKKLVLAMAVLSTSVMTSGCGVYSYYSAKQEYENGLLADRARTQEKAAKIDAAESIEATIFSATQRMIKIRKRVAAFADVKNLTWLTPYNIHVAGFIRHYAQQQVYCLFNFSNQDAYVTWFAFKTHGNKSNTLYDHWSEKTITIGSDHEYLIIPPYQFCLFEVMVDDN